MKRFENILYVNKLSSSVNSALQRAIGLAQSNEAKLTILNTIQKLPKSLKDLQQILTLVNDDDLKVLLDKIGADDVKINTYTLAGTPFIEIIKKVMQDKHDLVIKSVEVKDDLSSMLFDSTDMHLLRKCPCPVWVIKPSKNKKFSKILAAIDPVAKDKDSIELNKLILDLAVSLAQREGSELHIVHVWNLPYESMLRGGHSRFLPMREVEQMVEGVHLEHQKLLKECLQQYDFKKLPYNLHLLKGEPGDAIPYLSKKENVELIVMGTVTKTSMSGFIIGSTAEKILTSVDCSVLAVKPSSFVSPVL